MRLVNFNRRSAVAVTLLALMLAAIAPAYAAAATRPITLKIFIGDQCLAGKASDNAFLAIDWRDGNGALKYSVSGVPADGNGNWEWCSQLPVHVVSGDIIRVTDTGSSDSHLLIVPELTIYGNRVTDAYKGRAPGGSSIKLICWFSSGFEPCSETWRILVSNTGKWSFRPGWDVGAGETIIAQWKSPAGDFVRSYGTPAELSVRIGSARIAGVTRNGSHPTIVLRRGQLMAMAHPDASPLDGVFTGKLRNQAGNKVKVKAGDLISSDIAADLQWVVPQIVATGASSLQHVAGHCDYDDPSEPQVGDFEILVFHNGEFVDRTSIVDFYDENGYFDVELEFQAGDRLLVRCGMGTGDWAEKMFTAV